MYLRLLSYLKGKIGYFALSIFGFLIFGATQPMLAKLMELVIDSIQNKNADARWLLPALALSVYLFRGIGSFIGSYFNTVVGAGVVRDLKLQTFQHLTKLPASFYDTNSQGKLIHNLNASVTQVQNAVTNALKTLIREGITIIALIGYAFYLNWQLSIIFLVIAPILLGLVNIAGKRFRKFARRNEAALGDAMQVSKELISNNGLVRAFGGQEYERTRYRFALDSSFKAQMKSRKIGALFTPIAQLIVSCAVAAIIFMLLSPTILETHSTGELIGYLTAIALLPKSVKQLGGIGVTIQQGLVGAEMVFNLLDAAPEKDEGDYAPETIEGKVEFRNLSFRYPGTDKLVLRNMSAIINSGDTAAIVGESGSGKTTLVSLLYRQYDVEDGTIFLDDIDINRYKLTNLRKHISIVSQDIRLFDDTLRNNVAYGDEHYSDAAIFEALTKAHATEFIEKLPHGMDTILGENGALLSGGQRQRISLARALLKDSPLIIMDEATSALDNTSESYVTHTLRALNKSKTVILIGHRPSTTKDAKLIISLNANGCDSQTHS
ncbi:MAG: ATP-binding cassette domain-containing protein [Pseudomonadales bacterium]|nr:ATP-binding cassette domain-containing protein [Pseudomonadales bacterium]